MPRYQTRLVSDFRCCRRFVIWLDSFAAYERKRIMSINHPCNLMPGFVRTLRHTARFEPCQLCQGRTFGIVSETAASRSSPPARSPSRNQSSACHQSS
jgi:hypothetical protein